MLKNERRNQMARIRRISKRYGQKKLDVVELSRLIIERIERGIKEHTTKGLRLT